jgi:hypothetical protein
LTGFPSRVAAIAIATLPLVASSTVMSIVAFDAAYAQNNGNGNGNGGRNGNGGGNGGGPPAHANAGRGDADEDTPRRTGPPTHANAGGSLQGRIARELGGANASNASARAFANASDESMIGRLREVYEYFGETDSALSELEAKQEAFDMAVAEYLESGEDLRLRDEIEASITDVNQRIADLEALDPPPDDFDDQLADLEEELEGYTAELEDYESAVGEAESDLAGLRMLMTKRLKPRMRRSPGSPTRISSCPTRHATNFAAGSMTGSAIPMRSPQARRRRKRPDAPPRRYLRPHGHASCGRTRDQRYPGTMLPQT